MAKLLLHICCGPCSIYVTKVLSSKFQVQCFFYNPNIHPEEEYKKRKDCFVEYAQQNNLPVIWGEYKPERYFDEVFSENQKSLPRRQAGKFKKAAPWKSLRDKQIVNNIYKLVEKGNLYIPKEIRCPVCYRLRLEKTAQIAHDEGFDFFSTTLLVSPYQNLQEIKEIGEEQAKKYRVKFYPPSQKVTAVKPCMNAKSVTLRSSESEGGCASVVDASKLWRRSAGSAWRSTWRCHGRKPVGLHFEDFTCEFKKSQQKAKELNLYRQRYCGCIFSKFKM